MNKFSPNFKVLEIPSNQRSLYKIRYKLIGNSEINTINYHKEKVTLEIPITADTLKIIEIINISTYDTPVNSVNAILILLDGNNGDETDKGNPDFILQSNFKLTKLSDIGVDLDVLESHGKLLIITLHDDEELTEEKITAYKSHAINQGYLNNGTKDYNEIEFASIAVTKKPKEEDGTIIFVI